MPTDQELMQVTDLSDPEAAARQVRRVFRKISQEIDVDKYGLSGLLLAVEKALGIANEDLNGQDQTALVEFFGLQDTRRLLLSEADPSVAVNRAREVSHLFELFMQAVRQKAEPAIVWRLGRRLGHEFINALADRTIRN